MNWIQVLLLSVVEGVTEFLPISSTGHLILASSVLGIVQTDFVKSFEVGIQLGAIMAVVILYAGRLLTKKEELLRVIVAFVPTAVIGLGMYKLVKNVLLGNMWVTVLSLGLGGLLIILARGWFEKRVGERKISDLSYKEAALLGVVQSLAIVPGVSRALVTIWGGMYLGLSKKAAVEMSFMLAIPTMAAATGLDLIKSGWGFTSGEWFDLGLGLVGAFITAWLVVKWFIGYVQKRDLVVFGWYRIAVAAVFALVAR